MSSGRPPSGAAAGRQTARLGLRFRGLRTQIILWTVLPLTLVLIGVAFTGVYSHERAMRTLVQERDQALAVVSAAQVSDLLSVRSSALETLAAEQVFHHDEAAGQRILLAEAGDVNGLFMDSLALVDETGAPLASAAEPPVWLSDPYLPDLARAVMTHQHVVLTPLSDAPWGEDVFLIGVPVNDENGVTYGVLAGPVSISSLDLQKLLSQAQVGEHGVVYLVDASGRILAHSASEYARSSLAGHSGLDIALQADGAGVALCRSPDGERMTLAYAPVDNSAATDSASSATEAAARNSPPSMGWRVLVEQPWQEVIGPVLRYSQFVPLVAALAVIVSLLALYYGVQSIVRPLQALGKEAEQVAWGDFEATGTPVGGVAEIEDLRRTLDQMARRIQGYQRGMHDYIAAITQGQEEERRRLARELHDETAQALIALGQQVEMAQKLLVKDPGRAAVRLAQVRVMLAETVEGIRRFSRDLRPIYLEELGFIPALEMLTRSTSPALQIEFATTGPVRRLPPDLELAVYRIVQEALNNTVQHAEASHAGVEVRFEDQHLVLSVRDDGRGFQPPDLPDALARRGHFGLMGIQERVLLYGGQLTIRSAPGEGTEITVRLPYPSPTE
jgi:signal transduction histidine kinase